ncbi:MAG: isopenicillin N synthase family dioxygenase [Acidimicrobiales bacterium]
MGELVVHPIDLAPFREGGPEDRAAVATAIDVACRDTGFLVLTGHGVPQATIDDWVERSTAFFERPMEEKRDYVVTEPSANRGYTEPGKEGLAYTLGSRTPPDLFEAMTYGREDAIGPRFDAHRHHFRPNRWPDEPAGLREAFLAYEAELRRVADDVLRAMAIALDLPEGWLVGRCAGSVITTRAISYRRYPGSPDPEPGQMRLGAHTDYGVLTLLWADDVPGLQVQRSGTWHDVSFAPRSFLGNIGDMLAMWTNDRWHSTLHRVVPPPASSNGPVRRRSVARFLDGDPSVLVECIPSCCSADNPARYAPVNAGEWLRTKIVGGRTLEVVELPSSHRSADAHRP